MHVSLSDLLTCPRCGPEHGLILLPGAVSDRRVRTGVLGCAGCGGRYGIEGGVADLRGSARAEEPGPGVGPASEAGSAGSAGGDAVRLGALLGLAGPAVGGGGVVVLAGPSVATAVELRELVESVEVVVVGPGLLPASKSESAAGAVSRVRAGDGLPLRSGSVAAVALTGGRVHLLDEAARVLRPAGRLVLEPWDEMVKARASGLGLRAVAEDESTLVLARRA